MPRASSWLLALLLAGFAIAAARELAPKGEAAPVAPAPSATAPRPAPKPSAAPVLREITKPASAGEEVSVELMDPPASMYAAHAPPGAEAGYAAVVEKLGRDDVIYDPALSRAARELAYQQSLLGGLVPQDIVDFLLRSSGAVDRTVTQGFTSTRGDGAEAARQRLEEALAKDHAAGVARVGIGEVWIPGASLQRIVGVLISRREVDVAPAPRRVDRGDTWEISGVLPRGYRDPTALVLHVDGRLEPATITTVDRRFRLAVPAGDAAGTLTINVGADGPFGHTTLFQLPVEVGQGLPEVYTTRLPLDESKVKSAEAAEPIAFALLNADRARFGLPALVRDARLDAIARAHSADMRDHGYFGHRSPTTGEPHDRLEAAGYRAVRSAENLAREQSIHAAESNLFASLGHRKNILATGVTHVGIGVAARDLGGRMEWHLTQLFARPVAVIDEAAAGDGIRAAIDARRKAAGIAALARDRDLDEIAKKHARAAAEWKTEGLGRRVLDSAKKAGLLRGAAKSWILRTADVSSFEAPDEALDAAHQRIGVGIVQLPDDPRGATGVVLIFAGE